MGLNESKGNMYDFVTHTWNTVKGKCPHGCTYCYMKRWGEQRDIYFDKREMKTDLGKEKFIFVGSSCDLFAEAIPNDWILDTILHIRDYNNRYLFQSKNTEKMSRMLSSLRKQINMVVCTTIETNRFYDQIMHKSPLPEIRSFYMGESFKQFTRYVTIEPIMDFDLEPMVELIKRCNPEQVNIGADSGRNALPEPHIDKVLELIERLKRFTTIAKKKNLDRLGNITA